MFLEIMKIRNSNICSHILTKPFNLITEVTQRSNLIDEHVSGTRLGGWLAKKLFERSEFFFGKRFCFFFRKKRKPPAGMPKSAVWAVAKQGFPFHAPAGGFLFASQKKKQKC